MKFLVTLSIVVAFACLPALAGAWEGKVAEITDGDRITVLRPRDPVRGAKATTVQSDKVKIRLYGVTAPGVDQAYGKHAKQFTSDQVLGKVVTVEPLDQDIYGCIVANIQSAAGSLAEALVKAGFAWRHPEVCKRKECAAWGELEDKAKKARVGLWVDPNPMPPWDFRAKAGRSK